MGDMPRGADEVRRFFLLAARRHPPPEAIEAARPLAGEADVVERAAAISMRMGQEPLYSWFLRERFPEAPLSEVTRLALAGQSRLHAFRWLELEETARDALAALGEAGVRPILLKGISHVEDCYEKPELRPMRDIDFLVREPDLEAARKAMEKRGFLRNEEEAARYEGHHHLPPFFHPGTELCIEVHHRLMRLPPGFEGFPALDEVWRSARESRLFQGALLLEPTMQVLNLCIHITHGDSSINRRAQNLIDLLRTFEVHGQAIDWGRLLAHARGRDMARSLALPLLYLRGEGLPSAPEEAVREIARLSGLASWEIRLLTALVNRYRIGSPAPWGLVSGRISNILWRHTLRRGPALGRAVAAVREALARG
jgi:hypothetical protein